MGKDPCKKWACAIQDCLQLNNFSEDKCQAVIDALFECCAKLGSGESVVCSGIHPRSKPGHPTVLDDSPKRKKS